MASFDVTFVGTGVSTAVPCLRCVLRGDCRVCQIAHDDPLCKTARGNVSILLTFKDSGGESRAVMVDVGKTFRPAAMRHLKPLGVRSADVIFLTHDHFDAIGGLDDVRDLQETDEIFNEKKVFVGYKVKKLLRIVTTEPTMVKTRNMFPYLFPQQDEKIDVDTLLMRRIARIQWETIEFRSSMDIHGLQVETFPVYHGGTYISLGFSFGPADRRFLYISDISGFPPETQALLESWIGHIDTLVIDALYQGKHTTHFSVGEAVECGRWLCPRRTLLVGMTCDAGTHEELLESLLVHREKDGLWVEPAYDGMHLTFGDDEKVDGGGGGADEVVAAEGV